MNMMDQNPYGFEQQPMPQPQPIPMDYGNIIGGEPQHGDDLVKWQLDNTDIFEQVDSELRGLLWDTKTKAYIKTKTSVPRMNDAGIRQVLFELRGRLNKNLSLTSLEQDDIYRILRNLGHTLVDLFTLKYEEYEMDKEQMDSTINFILDIVEGAIRRAKGQGERAFQARINKNIFHRAESVNMDQQKKGWRLFGIGGG